MSFAVQSVILSLSFTLTAGLYCVNLSPAPNNPNGYMQIVHGSAVYRPCPPGTIYYPHVCVCNFPGISTPQPRPTYLPPQGALGRSYGLSQTMYGNTQGPPPQYPPVSTRPYSNVYNGPNVRLNHMAFSSGQSYSNQHMPSYLPPGSSSAPQISYKGYYSSQHSLNRMSTAYPNIGTSAVPQGIGYYPQQMQMQHQNSLPTSSSSVPNLPPAGNNYYPNYNPAATDTQGTSQTQYQEPFYNSPYVAPSVDPKGTQQQNTNWNTQPNPNTVLPQGYIETAKDNNQQQLSNTKPTEINSLASTVPRDSLNHPPNNQNWMSTIPSTTFYHNAANQKLTDLSSLVLPYVGVNTLPNPTKAVAPAERDHQISTKVSFILQQYPDASTGHSTYPNGLHTYIDPSSAPPESSLTSKHIASSLAPQEGFRSGPGASKPNPQILSSPASKIWQSPASVGDSNAAASKVSSPTTTVWSSQVSQGEPSPSFKNDTSTNQIGKHYTDATVVNQQNVQNKSSLTQQRNANSNAFPNPVPTMPRNQSPLTQQTGPYYGPQQPKFNALPNVPMPTMPRRQYPLTQQTVPYYGPQQPNSKALPNALNPTETRIGSPMKNQIHRAAPNIYTISRHYPLWMYYNPMPQPRSTSQQGAAPITGFQYTAKPAINPRYVYRGSNPNSLQPPKNNPIQNGRQGTPVSANLQNGNHGSGPLFSWLPVIDTKWNHNIIKKNMPSPTEASNKPLRDPTTTALPWNPIAQWNDLMTTPAPSQARGSLSMASTVHWKRKVAEMERLDAPEAQMDSYIRQVLRIQKNLTPLERMQLWAIIA